MLASATEIYALKNKGLQISLNKKMKIALSNILTVMFIDYFYKSGRNFEKMKYLFVIIVITLSCSFPVEDDYYPEEEIFSFYTYNIEKEKYKKICSCCSGNPMEARWLIDDSLFVVKSDDIDIMDINGNRIQHIQKPKNIAYFNISENGSMIVLACSDRAGADMYLVETGGYEIIQLTNSPLIVEKYPKFSIDNTKIVYSTYVREGGSGLPSLNIYDIESDSIKTILTRQPGDAESTPFWYPHISKDNKIIYYTRSYTDTVSKEKVSSLYSIHIDGSDNTLLVENVYQFIPTRYAVFGDKIVYEGGEWPLSIYVFDTISKSKKNYGNFIRNECRAIGPNPIFQINKEGTLIVVGTDYCRDTHIYLINVNSDKIKKLAIGNYPNFSSDGNTILFLAKETK